MEYLVTCEGKPAGRILKFVGNAPSARWVAYRHRERGDITERPEWTGRFRTLREAREWLWEEFYKDAQ